VHIVGAINSFLPAAVFVKKRLTCWFVIQHLLQSAEAESAIVNVLEQEKGNLPQSQEMKGKCYLQLSVIL
jgi:hypothetical protein